MNGIPMLILSVGSIIAVLFFVTYASQKHDLNGIKDKTVGNGQHGTARWATRQEVKRTYHHVPFTLEEWRQAAKNGNQPTANGKPLPQGIVLGCQGSRKTTALVDSDDVHVLMIGASGVGKTAYFLYPNLEYACASGMSFLALDTKGDLARNYGAIARDIYGYRISVVDLREPTRSDGNNLLTLINRYNLVIYGHHMNNGSMFADLCKYTDKDFYEEHKTIRFDTLSEFGAYEIVAVFKTVAYSEDGFKYYHFVDGDEEAFDEYIAKCRELSLYDTGVTAEYGDSLITLSTCEYSRTNGRMVVVAKKIASPNGEVNPDA